MEETVLSKITVEKEELDANLVKLRAFLKKEDLLEIVGAVQAKLLLRQKNAMENYSDVLHQRIIDLQSELPVNDTEIVSPYPENESVIITEKYEVHGSEITNGSESTLNN